VATGPGLCAL